MFLLLYMFFLSYAEINVADKKVQINTKETHIHGKAVQFHVRVRWQRFMMLTL